MSRLLPALAAAILLLPSGAGADLAQDIEKANGLRVEKRYAEALTALSAAERRAAEDDEGLSELLFTRGLVFEESGELEKAKEEFGGAVERYPAAPVAPFSQLGLARVLEKEGKLDEALAALQYLIGAYPKMGPAALMQRAGIEERMEDLAEAARSYRAMAGSYPNAREAAQARSALEGICERLVQTKDTVTGFEDALGVGECLMDQGRFPEARGLYQKMLKRRKTRDEAAQLWMEIAYCYEAEGSSRRAESAFRRVLRLVPGTTRAADAQMAIVQSRLDAERWSEAIRELRRMVKAFPGTAEAARAQFLIATCYEGLGQLDKAKAAYSKVVEMAPQTPWAAQAQVGMMRMMEKAF